MMVLSHPRYPLQQPEQYSWCGTRSSVSVVIVAIALLPC